MLEIFKTLGSYAGWISVVVLIYDRLLKVRPVASLSFGDDNEPYIRVNNPSDFGILVLAVTVHPNVFALSENFERDNILRSIMGRIPSFILRASESKNLFLITKTEAGLPLELKQQRVKFRIRWRRGNSTWIPQPPVLVRTSTEIIRRFSVEQRSR